MSTDKPDYSRRLVVGGLTGGLAAMATGGARAQDTQAAAPSASAPPLVDPTTKYPKPPFPRQEQDWPGLASRMDPRPDHGEESYRGSGRLAGRRALITGGDSGIGRAAAIAYAREGADVAINYLPAEESDAREVADLIRAEGRKVVPIAGDIRDEGFCNTLVESTVRELGGLDILVNNAARQHAMSDISGLTTELLDWTFKTNLYALFWITKAALPHLKPGSAIINTTSVVAYDPPEGLVDYAVTKAGIMNFTKSMAKQLAPKGIRVNGVAPGPFWTPLQPSGGQPTEELPTFGSDTPMGRPGQPAELAGVYVLLASGEDSYATGQIYGAVGGRGGP
ncbi:SDR family oxidoreductase [Chthonobacter rhizosphaerae]|uniref:SDR family oxidoreductase n=1 Tax=Chthonobacter rhizosphaerae TaxID=2735553 RepID=UPI0015EEAF17|nr:SDR family oxidoreductase [Chthonobacter rhizosphaerae]